MVSLGWFTCCCCEMNSVLLQTSWLEEEKKGQHKEHMRDKRNTEKGRERIKLGGGGVANHVKQLACETWRLKVFCFF